MWGDTVHVPEIQIPRPEVTSEYRRQRAARRRKPFQDFQLCREKSAMLVTGGHLHLPGFAHVVPNGRGFQLIPEPWTGSGYSRARM